MKGQLPVFGQSFFLSPNRKDGLQLKVMYEDHVAYTDLFVDTRFEGYTNIVHGGMIFGILDVVIWYVILMESKKIAMTRKVKMEFLRPVQCNKTYRAVAKFIKVERKDIHATAWVEDKEGEVYAKVEAVFRESKEKNIAAFLERLDFSMTSPELKQFLVSLLRESS